MKPSPTKEADDLWAAICRAADANTKPPKRTPADPTAEAATERALIEALCGGMTRWTNDAQLFILHHWQCVTCGASGEFPNLDPRGRLVKRHNRAGTSWISHDPSDDLGTIGQLPREFQHHYHTVGWCHHCVQEQDHPQFTFQFLPPTHVSPGVALRSRPYV